MGTGGNHELTGTEARALEALGASAARTQVIPANHGPDGNGNWHVWPLAGERCVLRRYYAGATAEDLAYEHAILRELSSEGWCVPDPLTEPLELDGRWYCLTRYVPGRCRMRETPQQSRQRGADLARLHLALRPLAERLGQRPKWHPLRAGLPVMTVADWRAGLDALADDDPALASWAAAAASSTADELAALGAADLPLTVIHGDFMAEQNVHYDGDRLAGVIDFGVAHLGSRPYELVSARSYRAPDLVTGYTHELHRLGWPLSEQELAALVPVERGFQLGMVAWQLLAGTRGGRFDTTTIETHLTRTGIDPSGRRLQIASLGDADIRAPAAE
jgi:Ser/Thr protein kinase RdoA (MazF antagonist)